MNLKSFRLPITATIGVVVALLIANWCHLPLVLMALAAGLSPIVAQAGPSERHRLFNLLLFGALLAIILPLTSLVALRPVLGLLWLFGMVFVLHMLQYFGDDKLKLGVLAAATSCFVYNRPLHLMHWSVVATLLIGVLVVAIVQFVLWRDKSSQPRILPANRLTYSLRRACRIAIVAVVSFVLAKIWVSQFAGWASLTAIVISQASLGMTMKRLYQRVFGTLAGVVVALLINSQGWPHLLDVSLILLLFYFLIMWLLPKYYFVGAFFLTLTVALAYYAVPTFASLTSSANAFILDRLFDTLVGALVAGVAEFTIFPYSVLSCMSTSLSHYWHGVMRSVQFSSKGQTAAVLTAQREMEEGLQDINNYNQGYRYEPSYLFNQRHPLMVQTLPRLDKVANIARQLSQLDWASVRQDEESQQIIDYIISFIQLLYLLAQFTSSEPLKIDVLTQLFRRVEGRIKAGIPSIASTDLQHGLLELTTELSLISKDLLQILAIPRYAWLGRRKKVRAAI